MRVIDISTPRAMPIAAIFGRWREEVAYQDFDEGGGPLLRGAIDIIGRKIGQISCTSPTGILCDLKEILKS